MLEAGLDQTGSACGISLCHDEEEGTVGIYRADTGGYSLA